MTLAAFIVGTSGSSSREDRRCAPAREAGARATVAAAGVAGIAVLGFVGNDALDRAEYALGVGNPSAAIREARIAKQFAPWSPYPLTVRVRRSSRSAVSERPRAAFRDSIDIDDGYWRAWLGLGVASSGASAVRRSPRRNGSIRGALRYRRPKSFCGSSGLPRPADVRFHAH